MRMMSLLYPEIIKLCVDTHTYIHPSAQVDFTAYIGSFVYIGSNWL